MGLWSSAINIVIEYTVKSDYIFKQALVGPFVGSVAEKVLLSMGLLQL